MNEIVASSWAELVDALYLDSWDEGLGRYRSRCAFRGLAECGWKLKTSLMRLGGESAPLERHLLRNFRKYAYRTRVEHDSFWYWLSLAQHHGLPTRLLDWTYSPFVAMHFATANVRKMDRDGVIWVVDYVRAHADLPEPLKETLRLEGANVYTVDMLSKLEHAKAEASSPFLSSTRLPAREIASLEEFDNLSADPFLLFFEPPSMDDRIVNQHALFTVVSDARVAVDDLLSGRPELWRKVVVPASLKWEIRDKLDQANVTERVLFPGLEGLSAWLKRHYSPSE